MASRRRCCEASNVRSAAKRMRWNGQNKIMKDFAYSETGDDKQQNI